MKQATRDSTIHATTHSLETVVRDRILSAMGEPVRESLMRALSFTEEDGVRVEVTRAFPWSRLGGGLVEYTMGSDGRPGNGRIIWGQMNPDGKRSFRDPIIAGSTPLEPPERARFLAGHRALYLPDPGMMMTAYPFDPRMDWLTDLLDPERIERELQGPLCRALDIDRFSVDGVPERLGYRYGRRCTLSYRFKTPTAGNGDDREIRVIGKTQYDDRGREVFRQLEQLWNRPFKASNSRPLRIPQPLCSIPEYRICFHKAVEGDRLYDIREERALSEAIIGAADLISAFHRSGLVVEGRYVPEDELALLRKWIVYLMIIEPESRELAQNLLADLRRVAGDPILREVEPVIVHRDYFDKQVIRSGDHDFLIDLDTVTMSDPAIDLGNFVAHIVLRAYQFHGTARGAERDIDAFVSTGLEADPSIEPRRIAFYAATSLFRLACLYAYRPRWSHLPVKLLEASADWSRKL